MSIVEDFAVSLKDFLPIQPSCTIQDRSGRTVVVSDRLRDRLRDYAKHHEIPLTAALERLRDEVHNNGN